MLVWGFFRLPETQGRSFDELDVLFAKKVSARKFKSTVVDTFDESETAGIVGNARE
jgi:SP family general alpha glucoside:H+ symporter-like MFS transporter